MLLLEPFAPAVRSSSMSPLRRSSLGSVRHFGHRGSGQSLALKSHSCVHGISKVCRFVQTIA